MESTDEEAIDVSPMELLPTEVLQKILSNLPVRDRVRVERVCKRWKNVSNERVWEDVQVLIIKQWDDKEYNVFHYNTLSDLYEFGKSHLSKYSELHTKVTELGMIQSLVSRAGQHIKEFIFDLDYDNHNIEPVLSIMATYCHNIESIHLQHVDDSDIEAFSRLLESNKQLHSITCCNAVNVIEILPLRDWKSLSLVSLIFPIIQRFQGIQKDQWEEKIVALIENSPSLEKFYVYVWTPNILTAISKCEQLRDLFLPIRDEKATNDLIMHTSLLNRLTCLKVESRENDDDDPLVDLLHHCINLESLHLLYQHFELPDKVQEAVLTLPKLESLELNAPYLTDNFLSQLLKYKYLKISHDNAIIGNGIFEKIANSECLEKLEILGIDIITELFKTLAQNARTRREILKIRVDSEIYENALKMWKGSKIHIFEEADDLVSEIRHWKL